MTEPSVTPFSPVQNDCSECVYKPDELQVSSQVAGGPIAAPVELAVDYTLVSDCRCAVPVTAHVTIHGNPRTGAFRLLISSPQNPRVKATARLRDRSGRDEQGRIIIDGMREISRALAAGIEVVEIYCSPEFHHSGEREDESVVSAALQAGAEIIEVTPRVMEKIAYGQRAEGIVAVARLPQRRLSDLKLTERALVAVIEGVEKPGNLGAILRTADAAGVAAVIVASGITDLYNPNAIRASLGAIFTVPVFAATSEETVRWLRERGFQVFAARVDGSVQYTAADFRGRAAIALGSEAHGLTPLWQASDITAIRLPMLGQVDSLNLSATAAVLFYEALRQLDDAERATKM